MDLRGHDLKNKEARVISPLKRAIRFGLFGGLILFLISITSYYSNLSESGFLGALSIFVFLGTIYLSLKAHRDIDRAGKISFRRSLFVGTFTTLYMMLTEAVARIFHFSINGMAKNHARESSIEALSAMGFSDDKMDQLIDLVDLMMQPVNIIGGTVISALLIGLLISFMMAIFVSR